MKYERFHDAVSSSVTIVCSGSTRKVCGWTSRGTAGPNLPHQHVIKNRVVMTLQSSQSLSQLLCWWPPNTFHVSSLGKPDLEKKVVKVIVQFEAQMPVELRAEKGEERQEAEGLVFSFQTCSLALEFEVIIWGVNFNRVAFLQLSFHLIKMEKSWIFIFSRISVFKKDFFLLCFSSFNFSFSSVFWGFCLFVSDQSMPK